jgi:hypothetical protein
MTNPMVRIHNTETDEIIDREMNSDEFAHYEASQKANKLRQIEAENEAKARLELLKRLGITADEAALLVL